MKGNGRSGFTFLELITVIAILAVLAIVGGPSVMAWRNAATLRGAVNTLRGDLQMAKSLAIKQNVIVRAQFSSGGYTIVTAGGTVLKIRQLPAGVVINLMETTFLDNDGDGSPDTSFNGRGIPLPGIAGDLGKLVVNGPSGNRTISINTVGRIHIT